MHPSRLSRHAFTLLFHILCRYLPFQLQCRAHHWHPQHGNPCHFLQPSHSILFFGPTGPADCHRTTSFRSFGTSSSKFVLVDLDILVHKLHDNRISHTTRVVYQLGWCRYVGFCEQFGLMLLPFKENEVCQNSDHYLYQLGGKQSAHTLVRCVSTKSVLASMIRPSSPSFGFLHFQSCPLLETGVSARAQTANHSICSQHSVHNIIQQTMLL